MLVYTRSQILWIPGLAERLLAKARGQGGRIVVDTRDVMPKFMIPERQSDLDVLAGIVRYFYDHGKPPPPPTIQPEDFPLLKNPKTRKESHE